MKLSFTKLVALVCLILIAAAKASACKSGAMFHRKNSWEAAELEAKGATVIFEGTPELLT
jgi:hypothetical protein